MASDARVETIDWLQVGRTGACKPNLSATYRSPNFPQFSMNFQEG
jgi:hypothetical protein